jgi:hypothetical protein
MSQTVLQLNFNFNSSAKEYENLVSPLAKDFAAVPGLTWKLWLLSDDRSEAGGIYLFEDEEAFENFTNSDLAKTVLSHPKLANFSVKKFDVMTKVSAVTNAPLKSKAEAV